MKQKLNGLIVIAAVVLLAACGKKGPHYTQYIPKDATYVLAMDVKSMVSKLENDSLSVENMLEVIKDSANPSKYTKAIEMWKQFKDAGLDLDNKIYLAVPSIDPNAGNVNVQVLAGLKDEKKLQDFIAKMPNAPKVSKEGDISYAEAEGMLVGWNKEAVMILAGHSMPRVNDMYPGGDSAAAAVPAPVPGANATALARLKSYFNLKKDESLASVDAFSDLAAQKTDIAIFTNSTSLANSQANSALAMMPKVKALVEGIYSTTTLDFEDGKMVMKSQTFVGPKLAEILKKYTGPEVDMSLIDPYPSNNVDGVVAFSFKPELIPALLQEAGADALTDGILSQAKLTTTDITKAFKGDFAIVFSDFSMAGVEKKNWNNEPYMSHEPTAKFLVAVRIGDKASFDKLLGLATQTGKVERKGNRLVPVVAPGEEGAPKVFAGIENDLLIFSNDETVYNTYVAKSAKIGLSSEARNSLKGSSIGFFMDAEKILNSIPETMFDSSAVHEKNVLAKSKTLFKTLDFTTSNFDGKKVDGKGEVIMATNKNSLPQLVRFLMYAASEMKMKDAEQQARWNTDVPAAADTTAVPAP